jgi:hypothetical protein
MASGRTCPLSKSVYGGEAAVELRGRLVSGAGERAATTANAARVMSKSIRARTGCCGTAITIPSSLFEVFCCRARCRQRQRWIAEEKLQTLMPYWKKGCQALREAGEPAAIHGDGFTSRVSAPFVSKNALEGAIPSLS